MWAFVSWTARLGAGEARGRDLSLVKQQTGQLYGLSTDSWCLSCSQWKATNGRNVDHSAERTQKRLVGVVSRNCAICTNRNSELHNAKPSSIEDGGRQNTLFPKANWCASVRKWLIWGPWMSCFGWISGEILKGATLLGRDKAKLGLFGRRGGRSTHWN